MTKTEAFSNRIINAVRTKNSAYWKRQGNKEMVALFHEMAKRVPAYKNFLNERKIKASSVKDYKDLLLVPEVTKDNYLRKYSFKELSWDGNLSSPGILTSTSGSTGKPVYFSRDHQLNLQSSIIHELYMENGGFKKKEPTLVIVAFGMGVWIGGQITFQAFEIMRNRGYPLTIITPGINKSEIIKILSDIAPNFKQVLLAGYPPFLKDVVDEATKRKIKFSDGSLRLLFAAEPFTDNFRIHIANRTCVQNQLLDTMNIYGTAELGTMAFETPLSIAIRKSISKKPAVFNDVFPAVTKTPTLAQFIPSFTNIESDEGRLVVSGRSALPLMRYSIGDHGGVISYSEMVEKFRGHGISLNTMAKENRITKYKYELPFVYVYERSDFSTTLYGLQVYPEPIREVLLKKPYDSKLTGKFTLLTKFDAKHNQFLEINLEVQPGVSFSKENKEKLVTAIVKNLRKNSSEFRELSDYLTGRSKPKLVFWPTEDPLYFKPGVKQKWVTK